MHIADWLWLDLRYAARSLRRTPNVSAAAVATLGLGIGAVTTVFSMFQAVLLRPLPVRAPEQLYFVAHGLGDDLSTASNYPWFERVAQHADIFDGVTAYNSRDFKVSSGAGIEGVAGQYVSGNYHSVIGAPFALGRGFSAENDRAFTPSAVISYDYWSRRFGRNHNVLGATLSVGGHPVTIVGVTARGFDGMQPGRSIDITLPLSVHVQDDPEFLSRTDTWTSMPLVARLKAGVDPAQARSAIASTYRSHMSLPANVEFSRTRGQLREGTVQPAARGADRLRREYELPLQVLLGMVTVVWMIACVNVANLLLARAPARTRDVAVRMAIGASRGRIAGQLLTESLLLAACGGALGVLLAAWGTELVSKLFRTGMRPIVIDVLPDRTVLIVTIAVSLLTGLAFGLAPAWKTTAISLPMSLKVGGSTQGGRRRFGQHGLVVLQVALSLVLVFGAGLLARTLQNLRAIDGGFRKTAVVLFELDARDTAFPPERLEALCTDVMTRMKGRPEVLSGSCSTMSPIATNTEGRAVVVPGFMPRQDAPIAFANSIDGGYFETLGIEILRGRTFTTQDDVGAPLVAVISRGMAQYYFGDADPIGRTFSFGRRAGGPPIRIVGLVRDARQQLRGVPPHMAYTPLSQRSEAAHGLLGAVRTSGQTSAVTAAVRDEVRALTRDVAITYVRTMDEQIRASLVGERLLAMLSSAFAVLGLVLACVGLYGVTSYDVARRSRDIGIRMALGASRSQVLAQILREASVVTLLGLAIGAVGALAAARTLSAFLFDLAPNDLPTLVLAIAALSLTALVASYLPARRAARLDPAVTLRTE